MAEAGAFISEAARRAVVDAYAARTPASARAHARAARSLPGGVNRHIVHFGPHPLFAASAQGAWIDDLDGNRYLDALGNYTSMVVGHSHPDVNAAVTAQLSRGTAWAAASTLEAELAELVIERVPSIEQVRFTCTGTEATLMALRVARARTGRPLIAKFEGGYHGFNDYALPSMALSPADAERVAPPTPAVPAGIPEAVGETVITLPFNDADRTVELVEQHADRLAAVIVEPVMGVAGIIEPAPGFLEALREVTARTGVVLVFDEVMCFRVDAGGAQTRYGVAPDLTVLGKIIGGGFAVAAVGGPAELLSVFDPASGPQVLLSGTFHAQSVGLAAGAATLRAFPAAEVERLNKQTARLTDELAKSLASFPVPARINTAGSLFNVHFTDEPVVDYRSSLRGDKETMRWLHLALLNEGVIMGPRGIGCLSTPMHDDELDHFATAFDRAVSALLQ